MIISQKKYDRMVKLLEKQHDLIIKQSRENIRLKEENSHHAKLIGLYEACINKGIKIDFPDVTGGGKELTDNGNIDFSDF